VSTELAGFSLKQVIEAILFSSQRPVSLRDLQGILKSAAEAEKQEANVVALSRIKEPAVRAALNELGADCRDSSRAYELRETASGWQLVTKAGFAPWLRQLFPEYRSARLSSPALETLAIIAYRQPITRADIEAVRGVAVDGVVQTLLDRGLIKIAGRAEVPGRPLLYETTQHFMDHFGLRHLDELPNSAELRRMHLPVAAAPGGAEIVQMEPPAEQSVEGTQQQDADSFKKLPEEEQP
jgi:segregation and condensation protein B